MYLINVRVMVMGCTSCSIPSILVLKSHNSLNKSKMVSHTRMLYTAINLLLHLYQQKTSLEHVMIMCTVPLCTHPQDSVPCSNRSIEWTFSIYSLYLSLVELFIYTQHVKRGLLFFTSTFNKRFNLLRHSPFSMVHVHKWSSLQQTRIMIDMIQLICGSSSARLFVLCSHSFFVSLHVCLVVLVCDPYVLGHTAHRSIIEPTAIIKQWCVHTQAHV